MSTCTIDIKKDFEKLYFFIQSNPALLLVFFLFQVISGVALDKASHQSLSFIQRLFLLLFTTTLVWFGKDYANTLNFL